MQVADRAAKERDEPPVATCSRDLTEMALEVTGHGVHAQARVGVDQTGSRVQEGAGSHVERDVAAQVARIVHRVEDRYRLA